MKFQSISTSHISSSVSLLLPLQWFFNLPVTTHYHHHIFCPLTSSHPCSYSYLTKVPWFIIITAFLHNLRSLSHSLWNCQPWLNIHLLCTGLNWSDVTKKKHKINMLHLILNLWPETLSRFLSNSTPVPKGAIHLFSPWSPSTFSFCFTPGCYLGLYSL